MWPYTLRRWLGKTEEALTSRPILKHGNRPYAQEGELKNMLLSTKDGLYRGFLIDQMKS